MARTKAKKEKQMERLNKPIRTRHRLKVKSAETPTERKPDETVSQVFLICQVTPATQLNSPVALETNYSPFAFNHNSFVWVCLQSKRSAKARKGENRGREQTRRVEKRETIRRDLTFFKL